MIYKQYSVVRLNNIHKTFTEEELAFGKRAPKAGDVATIIEVYEKPCLGYEIECSNSDGVTEWMITFLPTEIELELITEN